MSYRLHYQDTDKVSRTSRQIISEKGWHVLHVESGKGVGLDLAYATEAEAQAAMEKVEARSAARATAPAPIVVQPAPVQKVTYSRPNPRYCTHETDNRGICYSCGAYIRSADVGAFSW